MAHHHTTMSVEGLEQLKKKYRFSPAAFGVTHPVPANLMMFAIVVAGLIFGVTIRKEMFPEIRPDRANILLTYPGASPAEIEEGMVLKIEDKIADLDEVDEITTTINEGAASIVVKLKSDVTDVDEAVDEIQTAVDTIQDLPEEAEEPRVVKFETILPVIAVSIHGHAGEEVLKRAARDMQEDLQSLPDMGLVAISGTRADEIRVEVTPEMLLRHGVSLPEISDRVAQWMREVPGGTVRTGQESVRVRTMGVAERAEAVRGIVIRADEQGAVVRLGDMAKVSEAFEDVDLRQRMNGEPSVRLTVFNMGDGDTVRIAEAVRAYAAGRLGRPFEPTWRDRLNAVRNRLVAAAPAPRSDAPAAEEDGTDPAALKSHRLVAYELGASRLAPVPGTVVLHSDLARFIEGRLDLLAGNAWSGAILIFIVLLIFLNIRAAGWVMLGVGVSILGAVAFMALLGITLNLLTMFGLIVVLGILGDDAVVISENIFHKHRHEGLAPGEAAIEGANEIAWPVVSTVTTVIVAFLPLAFVEGQMGDFLGALPLVVACTLILSTLETLFILPPHMAHSLRAIDARRPGVVARTLRRFEETRERFIDETIHPAFAGFIDRLLRYRYIAAACALAVWLVSVGMVVGGRVDFTFFSAGDSEIVVVDLRMPVGTSIEKTNETIARIEQAALAQSEVQNIEALVGTRLDTNDWNASGRQTNIAQLYVELKPVEQRDRTSQEVVASMRALTGQIAGASSLRYEELQGGPGGQAINFVVTGDNEDDLFAAAEELKTRLARFEGVGEIGDDAERGQRELQVSLRPGAAALGFTSEILARQIRGALFGLEPHTYSADREEVEVRVMLDEASRRSLARVESLRVEAPNGAWVPLGEVAEITEGSGYAAIHRLDRKRAITVVADVNQAVANPEAIAAAMQRDFRGIEARYPGLRVEARGRHLETTKSLSSLRVGFLAACVMIYVNLAWLFGSYTQPFAVMMAIPFSLIGVIWGHFFMGYDLMILSLIGFVALTGVVVNDSLIYMEYYNQRRAEGVPPHEALVLSARRRLRHVFVTSITTVFGLLPLMLEQSFQARILIPMAISLGFGLLSSTFLVLVVLPCIVLIANDARNALHWAWFGRPRLDSASTAIAEPAATTPTNR